MKIQGPAQKQGSFPFLQACCLDWQLKGIFHGLPNFHMGILLHVASPKPWGSGRECPSLLCFTLRHRGLTTWPDLPHACAHPYREEGSKQNTPSMESCHHPRNTGLVGHQKAGTRHPETSPWRGTRSVPSTCPIIPSVFTYKTQIQR